MEDKRKIYTVTALIALAGILVSLVVSCFAGGMTGYWIASRQTREVAGELFQELEERERFEQPEIVPPELFEEEFEFFRGRPFGTVVTYVEPGSPADRAGLEES